jgi:hypothetical protein
MEKLPDETLRGGANYACRRHTERAPDGARDAMHEEAFDVARTGENSRIGRWPGFKLRF